MRYSLISSANGLPRNALGVLSAILLVPIVLVVRLVTMPFECPLARSAEEVARYLSAFIESAGGEWDWDDFISIPIANSKLEAIRRRAIEIDLPIQGEGMETLKVLLAEAETLAASDRISP